MAISRRGDLPQCDNWPGISLLDVTDKLFAHILQQQLQDWRVAAMRNLVSLNAPFAKEGDA